MYTKPLAHTNTSSVKENAMCKVWKSQIDYTLCLRERLQKCNIKIALPKIDDAKKISCQCGRKFQNR